MASSAITASAMTASASTTWEEYSAGTRVTSRVLFMNNGSYLKHNLTDNSLEMVNSKWDATEFYVTENCSPADQRLSYDLVRDDTNDFIVYKNLGTPEKGNKVTLVLCGPKDIPNFRIKHHFNDDGEVNSVSFVTETKNTIYAIDNFGEGKIVWWNLTPPDPNKGKYDGVKNKPNQIFKIVYL